jgi:hypothetical protein
MDKDYEVFFIFMKATNICYQIHHPKIFQIHLLLLNQNNHFPLNVYLYQKYLDEIEIH